MAEDIQLEQPAKQEIACPLCLRLGVVQNYRCTWRPQAKIGDNGERGAWECRPVAGTDSQAEEHAKLALEADADSKGRSYKFTDEFGREARKEGIKKVNAGEVRAPKKNWDKNFGPQGGRKLEELQSEFPDVYNTPSKRKKREQVNAENNGGEAASLETIRSEEEPSKTRRWMSDEELESLPDQIEGDGAYPTEEAYAVGGAAGTAEDLVTEGDEFERHQVNHYDITIQRPNAIPTVVSEAVEYEDEQGNKAKFYFVKHPTTGQLIAVSEGENHLSRITLHVQ